ncbi:hypothetical protein PG984_013330 [Apiospora sp. TS-2023a]
MLDFIGDIMDGIATRQANTPLRTKDTNLAQGIRPFGRPTKQPGSHYTHLETDELRLLILKPGKAGMPLECELAIYHRTHRVPYEALSYDWGDQARDNQIVCNGSPLQVTESIETALKHLRFPTEARTLWVDAVCIDQEDAAEKGHQIRFMDTIYSEAERVLVWLGPGTPETENSFRLVNRVFDRLSRQDLGPLLTLLGLPWFTRLWVFQGKFENSGFL